ncbi:MAG: hypothetical protein WCT77_13945, partial [Bacteroidota bacterium]
MKKPLSKILISVIMAGIFLLPISPVLNQKENNLAVEVKTNKVLAAISREETLKNSFLVWKNSTDTKASFIINIRAEKTQEDWQNVYYFDQMGLVLDLAPRVNPNGIFLAVFDESNKYVSHFDLTPFILEQAQSTKGFFKESVYYPPTEITIERTVSGLSSEKNYTAKLFFQPNTKFLVNNGAIPIFPSNDTKYFNFGNDVSFTTTKTGSAIGDTSVSQADSITKQLFDFDCSITKFTMSGCIANFVYVFFSLSAKVGELAAKFLDFFIYYSTNSDSYSNGFVTKGWSAIRDIANMFFIIALLY